MPPKLNLQRAQITPEFIDIMVSMYAEWMTRNERLIKAGTKQKSFEHFTHTARRMLPIVRRQSDDRVGLDYEITRLRGLPYAQFIVVQDVDPTWNAPREWDDEEDREVYDYSGAPQIPWLVGRTRFVTMTNYANRSEVMGYMGCYDVYIPSSIVRSPEIDHIHMIPQRNQRSVNRHPHHYLIVEEDEEITRSPLSYPCGNCYGDYSGVIKGMVDEPDFPELFRQLYGHLSTYGYAPPRHLDSLDFDIQTPEK